MNRIEFRAALADCELTQRAFARLIGRSHQVVSVWATAEGEVPGYAQAFLLAYQLLDHNGRAALRRRLAPAPVPEQAAA
jgi:DNA-binding transcriptional regulator YiaG